MTPEEIKDADDRQLSRHRLALLQRLCPVCDEGKDRAECRCQEELREVDKIEAELRMRGKGL